MTIHFHNINELIYLLIKQKKHTYTKKILKSNSRAMIKCKPSKELYEGMMSNYCQQLWMHSFIKHVSQSPHINSTLQESEL